MLDETKVLSDMTRDAYEAALDQAETYGQQARATGGYDEELFTLGISNLLETERLRQMLGCLGSISRAQLDNTTRPVVAGPNYQVSFQQPPKFRRGNYGYRGGIERRRGIH